MTEKTKLESGPKPEQGERNRLIEEHRRLDAEYDEVESKIDSFFRSGKPYRGPEDDSELSGLTKRRDKILEEIRGTEQALYDLDAPK